MSKPFNDYQLKFIKDFTSPLKQKFFFLRHLPMGIIVGLRLQNISREGAQVRVPYFWWNKNPFNSMYFAVQSMAAEMSTAALVLLALRAKKQNVAYIITNMGAIFEKKAQSSVTFICTDFAKVEEKIRLLETTHSQSIRLETIGKDQTGNVVAKFWFEWSFKLR